MFIGDEDISSLGHAFQVMKFIYRYAAVLGL